MTGNGNRYKKTVTASGGVAVSRYYSYDTSGNIVSEYKRVMVNGSEESQTLVRYVRDTGGKAISMIQGTNTYYFTYNGHGDVTALTDSTGAVVATYSYDEFGNLTSETGTVYNPLRYSGAHNAYYDSETASASSAQDGLYKMGTRYYQPDVGRWLTRDSYTGEQENPQSHNRYVYVENNPQTGIDPTGHYRKNLEWDSYINIVRQKRKDFYAMDSIPFGGWGPKRYYRVYRAYMKITKGFAIEYGIGKGIKAAGKKLTLWGLAKAGRHSKIIGSIGGWVTDKFVPELDNVTKKLSGGRPSDKLVGIGQDVWHTKGYPPMPGHNVEITY